MRYKALPWLRVCTFGLGAQSANIWIRDWNVRNAIIEVLVLRNPRTCPTPPGPVPSPLPAAILQWPEKVVWRLWSTFLGLEASSDYVALVGTARCEICTGKMEVPRCAVCSCSVANHSFCRRIESSP